jgi:hypothetical protein
LALNLEHLLDEWRGKFGPRSPTAKRLAKLLAQTPPAIAPEESETEIEAASGDRPDLAPRSATKH